MGAMGGRSHSGTHRSCWQITCSRWSGSVLDLHNCVFTFLLRGPCLQWKVSAEALGEETLRLRGGSKVTEHGSAGIDLCWNLLCLLFLLVRWAREIVLGCELGTCFSGWLCSFLPLILLCGSTSHGWIFPGLLLFSLSLLWHTALQTFRPIYFPLLN